METWLGSKDDITIEGYEIISMVRTRVRRAKRNSGDVSVVYRSSLNLQIVQNIGSENHIWVQLPQISSTQPVYLCALYNPPENSLYSDLYFFERLEQDIAVL